MIAMLATQNREVVSGLEPRLIQQTVSALTTAWQTFLEAAERIIELDPPFGGWLAVYDRNGRTVFACFIGELETIYFETSSFSTSFQPIIGRSHNLKFQGIEWVEWGADEAIALLVAIGMDELTREEAEKIANKSRNPVWPLMMRVLNDDDKD